jgi:hypothetical protein
MENNATTANSRFTDKKSAKEESEKKLCKDTEGSVHTNNGLKKMCWTFMIFCSCPSTSTLQPMCPSCQMSDQLIYSPLDTQNHFKQFLVKASSLAFTSVTPSFARKGR